VPKFGFAELMAATIVFTVFLFLGLNNIRQAGASQLIEESDSGEKRD